MTKSLALDSGEEYLPWTISVLPKCETSLFKAVIGGFCYLQVNSILANMGAQLEVYSGFSQWVTLLPPSMLRIS